MLLINRQVARVKISILTLKIESDWRSILCEILILFFILKLIPTSYFTPFNCSWLLIICGGKHSKSMFFEVFIVFVLVVFYNLNSKRMKFKFLMPLCLIVGFMLCSTTKSLSTGCTFTEYLDNFCSKGAGGCTHIEGIAPAYPDRPTPPTTGDNRMGSANVLIVGMHIGYSIDDSDSFCNISGSHLYDVRNVYFRYLFRGFGAFWSNCWIRFRAF